MHTPSLVKIVIIRKWKTDRQTDGHMTDGQMDRHTEVQRETMTKKTNIFFLYICMQPKHKCLKISNNLFCTFRTDVVVAPVPAC